MFAGLEFKAKALPTMVDFLLKFFAELALDRMKGTPPYFTVDFP